MTTGYENQLRLATGTETANYLATDSADAVTVAFCRFGELNKSEIQWFGTLGIQSLGLAVEMDAANLGGAVPKEGGRVERTSDGTDWRVKSVRYTHVGARFRCVLMEARD